jgi:hypothetical protein
MELPSNLKTLYRHWNLHLEIKSPEKVNFLFKDQKLFQEISWFIKERNGIWKAKTSGDSLPYTKDPILSTYRFCNIFREFDRQTIEFHTLLNPLRSDFSL